MTSIRPSVIFTPSFKPQPKPERKVKKAPAPVKEKSKNDLPQLIAIADAAFSRWIRTTMADKEGKNQCVTCPAKLPWQQMHNGHFVSRKTLSLRWDPRNCAPQCPTCNVANYGMPVEFARYVDCVHGAGTAHALIQEAKQPFKLDREHMKNIISLYKK